ncbi:acyltransferase domain-containing protein [Spirosoma sp. BT702]|uniref:Acyltransferase domain-containing protein n=1 Tax=Spirosoma profusum TaxID=2771354 RepID=A0A927AV96_9BACT|nr:type I polyketide synthase [Spirosoma profusum]MBD2705063.1 acyltransferase domain-containing protein [Spirosoma profusum]
MDRTDFLLRQTPVAIVGMASIFADAANLESYWKNIIQRVDSIREVPENRWKISDYYDPNPSTPDKTYCKVGGFIPEIDFNPLEFGLPPKLLEATDTAQLLSLSVARDALIDAGYAPDSVKFDAKLRERTGVILGVGGGQNLIIPLSSRLESPVWRKAMESTGLPDDQIEQIIDKIKTAYVPWSEDSFPGLLGNVIAGRIANRFDLGGINSVVDAACAASLSAVKMALSELIEGRCDMMLTGGVDTNNSPFMYMNFSKTPAFSQKGHIRPFDQDSDGMLLGEGLGIVVCKRLDDAIRDGDRIYATIRGLGSSSDGRFKSIYAPRPDGQALAMQRTYDEAGYDASTVGLIEAHGTGTVAGDLSEITSTKQVFGKSNLALNHIAIGSVKSQIGHTKSAAGIAGLIKAALALHHKILPATINVAQPNPQLGLEDSALYINTQTRPWFRKTSFIPRRAAVSAFGFGGVNLHTTLEEFNDEPQGSYRQHTLHAIILLHQANASQLLDTCRQQLALLQSEDAATQLKRLANESKAVGIPATHPRVGFVASSLEEARQKLGQVISFLERNTEQDEWSQPHYGIWYRKSALDINQKVVALFAGQGSQYVNMGSDLACTYPTVRSAFNQVNRFFEAKGQKSLTDVVFPIPVFSDDVRQQQEATLRQTEFAQPAIGALSAGMYRLLTDAGFQANYFAGHSYGELTALWAAGVLDDNAFYGLSKIRGEALGAASSGRRESGSMLAIKGSRAAIEQLLNGRADVWLSNINSPSQLVIGGKKEALIELLDDSKAKGYSATLLPVSAAFHTPLISQAQQPFADAIKRINVSAPSAPVFSNTTGKAYPVDSQQIKEMLAGHIVKPVRFNEQIDAIYEEGGRVFVEFGPKNILCNLVNEILADKPHTTISLNANPKKDADKQLREAIVQLTVLGQPLQGFDRFEKAFVEPAPKPKLSIKISGYNFVSEATRQRYEQALATPPIDNLPLSDLIPDNQNDDEAMNPLLTQIQSDIAALKDQQNRIEALLTNLLQNSKANQLNDSTPKPAEVKQESQPVKASSPLPINGVNGSKNGYTNGASIVHQAVPETPKTEPVTSEVDRKQIETSLLTVVAEKTGYPAEMLEMSMDMEADLGIDSIKRVEIFGAMTEAHPSVQGVKQQELAELRTLQQIVDYLATKINGNVTASPAKTAAPTNGYSAPTIVPANGQVSQPTPVQPPTSTNGISIPTRKLPEVDRKIIETSLLSVVAEKTGYPAEMLEMSMDMEADLGIDSIKRVEIFGTMTEAHPSVQGVKQQELAELRTLQQIVDYLATKMTAGLEVADEKKW